MSPNPEVTNIVIAGLGGQGVLKASDIIAGAAFLAGFDVKKGEIHGMSQRGGSVTGDVRFGRRVFSPMVPPGEADFLVLLDSGQKDAVSGLLAPSGILVHSAILDSVQLPSRRSLNVALTGALSAWLDIAEEHWLAAVRASFSERLLEANLAAFQAGREAARAWLAGAQRSYLK
ncbi:MAG: indolepyruvate oxidoreductase subunit beta [Bryobacteraceae bacterium]|nr:indolepyruvate oxidoreductase subunit beta [Bryobacteraceae bacterium]